MGKEAQCLSDLRDGLFCHNKEREKIYQITNSGTSVSKTGLKPPASYDFERNGLKFKQMNENCKISTSTFLDENGKKKETTLGLCYKNNTDSKLLDIGDNLVAMDKKLDSMLKGL